MDKSLKIVSSLLLVCSILLCIGLLATFIIQQNARSSFGYESLLSRIELLTNEIKAMNVDMKSRTDMMNEKVMEKLDRLETTLIKRFDNMENVKLDKFESIKNDINQHINQTCLRNVDQKNENEALFDKFSNQINKVQNTVGAMKTDLALIKTLVPPVSCKNLSSTMSGKFQLRPFKGENTIDVYCEQAAFGGGWLVFQRRFDGSVDFFRNWTQYRNGFGDVGGEFWLGLEQLHQLTKDRRFELIVELEANDSVVLFARYDDFAIGSEAEMYSLKGLGNFTGTARDALSYHRGRSFATSDRENGNCSYNYATGCMSAWWYSCGFKSDLNQPYVMTKGNIIHWAGFPYKEGIKSTKMMIREIQ
nr:ficolin-3-like [Aedes albopictus]